jgi:Spy/CpxP family protein refolding chaperone
MSVSRTQWCFIFVTLVGLASVTTLSAQERQEKGRRPDQGQGGPGRGGFQFGGGGGFGGALAILQRPDVQEELELLDDQKKQLTDLREKSTEKMRELFGNLRGGGGGEGDRDALRETFRKAAEETQADVDKILLPHQSKRLKQLEAQLRMRGGGVMGALGGDVADKLGISEEQRDKLRDKARDLDAELRKKTAEIRKQLQDQLLASLTEDQRKQFNELVGEPFEFKDEGPGFGGFGGFGGPGGGGAGGGIRRGDRPQNN